MSGFPKQRRKTDGMEKTNKKTRGLPINAVTVPVAVVLAVLHTMIIVLILMVNHASTDISNTMSSTSMYLEDATSLQAGSSVMSETSSAFVLTPALEDGTVNTGPLMSYIAELGVPRRGSDVLGKFEDREISEAGREALEQDAATADHMADIQVHAISLIRSVYPLPDTPQLATLPEVALTAEELAMPDEARLELASRMMISMDYARSKQIVSESINTCVAEIRSAAYAKAAVMGRKLGMLRTLLWVVTITIVVLLACFFVVLYRQLVFPLNNCTRLITSNDSLDEGKGLREVRVLASAYNALLKRRDALDAILRSAAETDALTNLPNRYRFEQYLLESGEGGYSMAVLLFDINFLKMTNDSQGHLAGDKLIRDAAECISTCFGSGPDESCFRFGGDEFAAIIKNCDEQVIHAKIRRFEEMQKDKGVSISMGYAYVRDVGTTTFKKLLDEADRKMYTRKKAYHQECGEENRE